MVDPSDLGSTRCPGGDEMDSDGFFFRKMIALGKTWCQVPGCSRRGARAYHVLYQCVGDHGGENLVSVCAGHMLTLRRGWVRVRGRAPDHLRWELGVRKGCPPLRVFEPSEG